MDIKYITSINIILLFKIFLNDLYLSKLTTLPYSGLVKIAPKTPIPKNIKKIVIIPFTELNDFNFNFTYYFPFKLKIKNKIIIIKKIIAIVESICPFITNEYDSNANKIIIIIDSIIFKNFIFLIHLTNLKTSSLDILITKLI